MLQVECALSSGDLCTESGMTNGLCVPLLCADYEDKEESHSQRMNFRGGEKQPLREQGLASQIIGRVTGGSRDSGFVLHEIHLILWL